MFARPPDTVPSMSSDEQIRRDHGDLPAFDFGETACATSPALADARVAIVTTAGLRTDGHGMWPDGEGFVALDAAERDVLVTHRSVNFDRTGLESDLNVAYPADRLDELADRGVIGSVASQHLSFMGAQPDHNLTTLRLDTGPAAAERLRADGVDVVLLTPV